MTSQELITCVDSTENRTELFNKVFIKWDIIRISLRSEIVFAHANSWLVPRHSYFKPLTLTYRTNLKPR